MLRNKSCLALLLTLTVLTSGCALFRPRPAPAPRPHHVIIVGLDGVKPGDIAPARTPHLYRMKQDGTTTWQLVVPKTRGRLATYSEALSLYDTTILARCRAAGLRANAVVRSRELKVLDPRAVVAEDVSVAYDNPVSVGAYAATRWLAQQPACVFVELSAGKDKPEDCDAGLGRLFAAVERAGLAARTTVIVMSASGPNRFWMIRGPAIRHGHEIAARLTPGSTAAAAAHLLLRTGGGASGGLFPAVAFRAYSREAKSAGERIVPRGSIRGRLLTARGRPLPNASVLLVKNEPVDGVFERRSDADEHGEFRFDSIPAGRYDYVFVFDNLPARLPRSLLVARSLEVKRDATTAPVLSYRRMQGSDKNAPPVPPAETSAAFLSDKHVERLRRTAHLNPPIPVLAADALSGRRVRTQIVREWLVASASHLHSTLQQSAITPALVTEMIDLAAAYDVNRASGLLTNTEDRDVRSALKFAVVHLIRAQESKELPEDARGSLALALTAGVLRSRGLSKQWLKRSDALFAARLENAAQRAADDPGSVDHADLCSMLAYAMVNRSLRYGDHLRWKLRHVTKLATSCLTPAERRVSAADRSIRPAHTLGFLGLAKSAFADRPLGERTRVLWEGCGSPLWAPRGNQSVLGALLTEARSPERRPLPQAASTKLTETTAVLTRAWGTPDEWFVRVNGWTVDLHVRGAKLATMSSAPIDGVVESKPRIVRFRTSPAYDYVLLAGRMSHKTKSHLDAYRHVLFNKLTGYLVITDELPAGVLSSTQVKATQVTGPDAIRGAQGAPAQVLAAATSAGVIAGKEIRFQSTSSRPSFVVYAPPAGSNAAAKLQVWDVTRTGLADDEDKGFGGVHLALTADRGREFIRIARTPAHVAGNIEDDMLQGSVGVIRRGPKSADLMLVRAGWAQTGDTLFKLERGHGYAAVHDAGRAEGWSRGRSSRQVMLWLGDDAPKSPKLTVDGSPKTLRQIDDRANFRLPSGRHTFRLK